MKFDWFVCMYLFFGIIFLGLGVMILFDGQYILSLFCLLIICIMIRDVSRHFRQERIDREYEEDGYNGCGDAILAQKWFECGEPDYTGATYYCDKCQEKLDEKEA